jgi:hypothetical protein
MDRRTSEIRNFVLKISRGLVAVAKNLEEDDGKEAKNRLRICLTQARSLEGLFFPEDASAPGATTADQSTNEDRRLSLGLGDAASVESLSQIPFGISPIMLDLMVKELSYRRYREEANTSTPTLDVPSTTTPPVAASLQALDALRMALGELLSILDGDEGPQLEKLNEEQVEQVATAIRSLLANIRRGD